MLLGLQVRSQTDSLWQLKINGLPPQTKVNYRTALLDSSTVQQEINNVLNQLQFEGYFYAEIEKQTIENKETTVKLVPNQPMKWLFLKNGNIAPYVLSDIRFPKKDIYAGQNFDLNEINKLKEQLLNWYDNHGFPFAQVWLDSFSYQNQHKISAFIFSNPGENIIIDTIRMAGSARVSQNFIASYLGIKNKDNYSEQKIKLIDKRIRELPFVTQSRKSEVEFSANKAAINLYLDKENANQFDGLIGFLPNPTTGKLQFTGDFKLRLQNALKQGETLVFNYKGLPEQSQELDLGFNYPYLMKTQMGVKTNFLLFKQDTSFLNLNTRIALVYNYEANQSLGFFVENHSSNIIAKNNPATAMMGNVKTQFYGIETSIQKLDNSILPLSGYKIEIAAGAGTRKADKLHSQQTTTLSEQEKITQFKFSANLNYYLKISRLSVFYLRNSSSVLTGKGIYENEVFRIGGLKTFRGFDEQQFRVKAYSIQTLEYRYFVEEKSYLNLFYDQGFINQLNQNTTDIDYPLGFGAGFTFQTKIGMLSLSYALGKQKNIPLDLQRGKIHFGIVSYF